MQELNFSAIEGFEVGHAQNREAATGCTVVLCRTGAVTGVDVRGGAPATRETDLLNPVNLVQQAHAVLLAGGSAFGLDAAAGVMAYLEENHIGFDVQVTRVPIVCAAALFDLHVGDHRVRPDRAMGYEACTHAGRGHIPQGTIGAGTGASVGKLLGLGRAMKGGLGTAAFQAGDLQVGALVAVNCLGDVLDPDTGRKVGGILTESRTGIADTQDLILQTLPPASRVFTGNTTLGVVITNAAITQAQATKLAAMAQNGFARTLRPAHSMVDGDTVFAMSCGSVTADMNVIGILAVRAMERAVVSAIRHATPLAGLVSAQELMTGSG